MSVAPAKPATPPELGHLPNWNLADLYASTADPAIERDLQSLAAQSGEFKRLGKGGKDIAPEKAMDHVFGFTIFNDFSARDAAVEVMTHAHAALTAAPLVSVTPSTSTASPSTAP